MKKILAIVLVFTVGVVWGEESHTFDQLISHVERRYGWSNEYFEEGTAYARLTVLAKKIYVINNSEFFYNGLLNANVEYVSSSPSAGSLRVKIYNNYNEYDNKFENRNGTYNVEILRNFSAYRYWIVNSRILNFNFDIYVRSTHGNYSHNQLKDYYAYFDDRAPTVRLISLTNRINGSTENLNNSAFYRNDWQGKVNGQSSSYAYSKEINFYVSADPGFGPNEVGAGLNTISIKRESIQSNGNTNSLTNDYNSSMRSYQVYNYGTYRIRAHDNLNNYGDDGNSYNAGKQATLFVPDVTAPVLFVKSGNTWYQENSTPTTRQDYVNGVVANVNIWNQPVTRVSSASAYTLPTVRTATFDVDAREIYLGDSDLNTTSSNAYFYQRWTDPLDGSSPVLTNPPARDINANMYQNTYFPNSFTNDGRVNPATSNVENKQAVESISGKYTVRFFAMDLAGNFSRPLIFKQKVLSRNPSIRNITHPGSGWFKTNLFSPISNAGSFNRVTPENTSTQAQQQASNINAILENVQLAKNYWAHDAAGDPVQEISISYQKNSNQQWINWSSLGTNGSFNLTDGVYQIALKAVDEVGAGSQNQYATVQDYTIQVDSTPPVLNLSYRYGSVSPILFTNGGSYFLNAGSTSSPLRFLSQTSDATSGLASYGYTVDGQGTIHALNTNSDLFNFVPETGTHTYQFLLNDNATNSATLSFTLTFDDIPVSVHLNNAKYVDLFDGTTKTLGETPINANQLVFQFTTNDYGFAKPQIMTAKWDNQLTEVTLEFSTFEAQSQTIVLSTPLLLSQLPDGIHLLHYVLTDQSGLTTSGTLNVKIHKNMPVAVSINLMYRYTNRTKPSGLPIWRLEENTWQIHQEDIPLVAGASGSDGLRLGDYVDTANTGNFSLAGYQFKVTDSISGQAVFDSQKTYQFSWGTESSRNLTIQVQDETGKYSSSTIKLYKPVWENFSNPVKTVDAENKTFSVQWAVNPLGVEGFKKGIDWYSSLSQTPSASVFNQNLQTGSSPIRIQHTGTPAIVVGNFLHFRPIIKCLATMSQDLPVLPLSILGNQGVYQIPYENLPIAQIASSYWKDIGIKNVGSLVRQTDDGMYVHYSLEFLLNHQGEQTSVVVDEENAHPGQFSYSLWSLFPSLNRTTHTINDLKNAFAQKTLQVRLLSWYGNQRPDGSNPHNISDYDQKILARGQLITANLDFDAPVVDWNPESIPTQLRTKALKGMLTDTGGSHLNKITISWALYGAHGLGGYTTPSIISIPEGLDERSFTINLLVNNQPIEDGKYAIQFQVEDHAGNVSSLPLITKIFDSQSPVLSSALQILQTTVDPITDAVYAQSDAHINIVCNSQDALGLKGIWTRWVDQAYSPIEGQDWIWRPVIHSSSDYPIGQETTPLVVTGAPSGISRLEVKLTDLVENTSVAYRSLWSVSYSRSVPALTLNLQGLHELGGNSYASSANAVLASFTAQDGVVPASDVQWNVVSLDVNGQVEANTNQPWSDFGASFESLRSRMTTNGQRYQIWLRTRNKNGVLGAVITSVPFILDTQGPINVSASLKTISNSFVQGQPFEIELTGTSVYSGLVWSWRYQNADESIKNSMPYSLGSDISIPRAGQWNVIFTATSGSGFAVDSTAISVSIVSSGLVVQDFQRFTDGKGDVAGSWQAVGIETDHYEYRWKTNHSRILQDWQTGDSSRSHSLTLRGVLGNQDLAESDVVHLEVRALDAQGNQVVQGISLGTRVDTSPPVISQWQHAPFMTSRKVSFKMVGVDEQSGIVSSRLLVKKQINQQTTWTTVVERPLVLASQIRSYSWDFSGESQLTSGDRVVLEVVLSNGAGLSASQTSSIIILDDSPPSIPIVIDGANAIRYKGVGYQTLSFQWQLSQGDPQSGISQYQWKAFTNETDLETLPWTDVPAGSLSVNNLDYSAHSYPSTDVVYPEGTLLRFAVKAVNGAGIESIGYSSGILLDSQAPLVYERKVLDSHQTEIHDVVLLANLGATNWEESGSVVVRLVAADLSSGFTQAQFQLGTWEQELGFVAFPGALPVEHHYTNSIGPQEVVISSPLPINRIYQNRVWMVKGRLIDKAGNESHLLTTGFRVAKEIPRITRVQNTLDHQKLSFSWLVDQDIGEHQSYLISLSKVVNQQLVAITGATNVEVSVKSWNIDWQTLGLEPNDEVEFSVRVKTPFGLSETLTKRIRWVTEAPVLQQWDYLSFFYDRILVKALHYRVPGDDTRPSPTLLEMIQWRAVDVDSQMVIQDWSIQQISGLISIEKLFTQLPHSISHGQKIRLEVRAKSEAGVWSTLSLSRSITIDQTLATDVSISRSNSFSNGALGEIAGFAVDAMDAESGLLAYQVVLLPASGNISSIDWNVIAVREVVRTAGQRLALSDVRIPALSLDGELIAYIRVQNGSQTWSNPVPSNSISVDRSALNLLFEFSATTFLRDPITNENLETLVTNQVTETFFVGSNKAMTQFTVSIDGLPLDGTITTVQGTWDYTPAVLSYTSFTLTKTATHLVRVHGVDRFGNEAVIERRIRFNEAPSVAVVALSTTPGRLINLEELINTQDVSLDYPLTYQWNIANAVYADGYTGEAYSGPPSAQWAPLPFHRAQFFQTGQQQVSEYPLVLRVLDRFGKACEITQTISVRNTTKGLLHAHEYWTGPITLTGLVEIPSGLELTLDRATINLTGILKPHSTVMESGIKIHLGGKLMVNNSASSQPNALLSSIGTSETTSLWHGIEVHGQLSGRGLNVFHAERALSIFSSGNMQLSQVSLSGNKIGLHLLGGNVQLSDSVFQNHSQYAVKEDRNSVVQIVRCQFINNRVLAYRRAVGPLNLGAFNLWLGNSASNANW